MRLFPILLLAGLSCAAPAETVLISGANSGIGLEFAKQYAARGATVIATHRRDGVPDSLAQLAARHPTLRIEKLDVSDLASADALAARLAGVPIDVLINNAGITGDFTQPAPQSLGTLDYAQLDGFVHTNARGALKLSEALLPQLRAGKGKRIVAITSLAGSVGAQAQIPGAYWYKGSKALLNIFMLNLAEDLRRDGISVALLSPGQVRVEKIGDAQIPGLIEPAESIAGMIRVIDGLSLAGTGKLYRYSGEALAL